MPTETYPLRRDPRTVLVEDKYFVMRPRPLVDWFDDQSLAKAVERVYWYHWDLSWQSGFHSQVPLRQVADDLRMNRSTVTRAYQRLIDDGLLVRHDGGRDRLNPFQQCASITEVRIPAVLVAALDRLPNRPRRAQPRPAEPAADSPRPDSPPATPTALADPLRAFPEAFSAAERARYVDAFRRATPTFEPDPDTRMTLDQQTAVAAALASMARVARLSIAKSTAPTVSAGQAKRATRRLDVLSVGRIRKGLEAAGSARHDTLREIAYSVEQGALSGLTVPHAINVALKKVREGAWKRPHGMPADWGLTHALLG